MLCWRRRRRRLAKDWGDQTLPERFRLAVDFLKSRNMDEAGQRAGAETCLWLLTSRLQFFEDFKRYPIGEEKIVQPLFATGEPRSGTTFCMRCCRLIRTLARCASGR